MRLLPSPALRRALLASGAALATGALLSGCDSVPFDLGDDFSDLELPDFASPSPSPSEGAGEEAAAPFTLPASCAEAGAAEIVGGLAPAGAQVDEQAGQVEDAEDAEQVACVWTTGGAGTGTGTGAPGEDGAGQAAETIALVFTVNTDPSDSAQVVQVQGAEAEANWEVDVDVNSDTYRTAATDSLEGEFEYLSTVEGSTRHLYLSLPGEFHITASAVHSEVTQEQLEEIVVQAAEQARS
ncbi:hypothetical protein ACFOVU_12295 [Nocardiopsis sediminis]|uniref:DUF3558 domain-containing protein n=1 Tax=Nocardiopsis sediminis TaxID=1778267 RepID=A0ABV8FKP2_9ACTN